MSITMTRHSKFPVELYDLIIDELAASNSPPIYSNSNPALQACLFVSRSFRHRACHHLFSGIRIDEEDAPLSDEPIDPSIELDMTSEMIHNRLRELVDIMRPPELPEDSACAHGIRPYIRHVYFGLQAVGAFDSDSDLADSEIARQSRTYALSILEMLQNPPSVSGSRPLKSFYIGGRGSELAPEWNNIPSTIRSSLLNLIRDTEDLSLRVDWMTHFPKHILRGTKVRSVDFGDILLFSKDTDGPVDLVDFPEYDDEGGVALLPLPSLDSATIRDAELLSPFCQEVYPKNPTDQTPRTLNRLAVELLSFEDCEHLNKISQEFPNIKTLNIFTKADYENVDSMPTYLFDLRHLRSLKRIEVSLNCAFERIRRLGWSPGITSNPVFESLVGEICSASYAFRKLIPLMSNILRSRANDSVSEIRLSFCELSIRRQLGPGGMRAFYDLDLGVFRELDMLLSSSDRDWQQRSDILRSGGSLDGLERPKLKFPSLRRCIIETVIVPEDVLLKSFDHLYELRDPEEIKLMRVAQQKDLSNYIRGGFPDLNALRSLYKELDLRITFGHH